RRGCGAGWEGGGTAAGGVEGACGARPSRAPRDPEVRAAAPAEVAAIALLLPVDRTVAARDAAARVDVALRARELPARESERGARRVSRRGAVPLLSPLDGAVPPQRGDGVELVGVV